MVFEQHSAAGDDRGRLSCTVLCWAMLGRIACRSNSCSSYPRAANRNPVLISRFHLGKSFCFCLERLAEIYLHCARGDWIEEGAASVSEGTRLEWIKIMGCNRSLVLGMEISLYIIVPAYLPGKVSSPSVPADHLSALLLQARSDGSPTASLRTVSSSLMDLSGWFGGN